MQIKAHERFRISKIGKFVDIKDPKVISWSMWEDIGLAVVNPRGCAKGSKSVIVGE